MTANMKRSIDDGDDAVLTDFEKDQFYSGGRNDDGALWWCVI